MLRKGFVLMMMGTVVFFLCSISSADVPHMINYQGKLTTASGGCLNDTVQMTFSIYPDTTGSPADWSETQTEVVVKEGVFSVLLGGMDSIPSAVFDGGIKYLGVQVESDPEMTPLKPIVSVAYAYKSLKADTADYAHVGDDDWAFRVTDTADTTLVTGGAWGIARFGNILYGNQDSTHVNLGVACTTGSDGQDYKYCTVGGGIGNVAGENFASVAGGRSNTAGGWESTVAGGFYNTASGSWATIGGGARNAVSGSNGTIAGGHVDTASGSWSTVGGGKHNIASESNATIAGGGDNTASATYATIGGGSSNTASGNNATVVGGYSNTASGQWSFVGGGFINSASGISATVGGGYFDTASGENATVGGGNYNKAKGNYSTVGGGSTNEADGYCATVAGGQFNVANGASDATVGGGQINIASASNSTVCGGYMNTASLGGATVAGGEYNVAGGLASTITGGYADTADGDYSLAAGRGVTVSSAADYTLAFGRDFTTSTANAVIFHNSVNTIKVGVGVTAPTHYIDVAGGAYCDGSQWHDVSSREYKKDICPLTQGEYRDILEKLANTEIVRYRYKSDDDGELHIGVIAEDAPEEMVDAERKSVPTGDAIGFLLAALKAQQAEIEALRSVVEDLTKE